jgi:predicted kinase
MSGKLLTDNNMPSPLEEQTLRDAAILREALGPGRVARLDDNSLRGTLVTLSGLPGTGKSHFARELTKQLAFLVLESDRIRKLLVPKPEYTGEEHSRVFAVCHLLLEDYLAQGRRVLFDATNLTEAFRRPLRLICQRLSLPLLLVRLTAPQDIVRARLTERAAGVHEGDFSDAGWPIYCRLAPYEEPIKGPHFTVDSSGNITTVLDEIARLASAAP